MEDVNAVIVIAAEAGDSLRQINSVRGSIANISDARMNDLRITQAKTKLELAEYKSAIAAQKAYNAEIKMEGAQTRLIFIKSNGASPKEIQRISKMVDDLRLNYLTQTIPTGVGKTSIKKSIRPSIADHPHGRGENLEDIDGKKPLDGPSPRAWGKRSYLFCG